VSILISCSRAVSGDRIARSDWRLFALTTN
jgi:hypothetical protein